MQKLLEHMAATAELMGQQISPSALAVMAKDLSVYPQNVVIEALGMLRRESKFKMTLAAVIEKVEQLRPDGRPGADEAWAMIPKDEQTSVVMTEEMAEALGIVKPLLDDGDKIAARMAFKEAYTRIVGANKTAGIKPKWFPSLGADKTGRDLVIAEAVRLGRLNVNHAIGLIAPDNVQVMLETAGEKNLALEYKPEDTAKALDILPRLKAGEHAKTVGSVNKSDSYHG